MSTIVYNILGRICLIVSKAILRPTRAPNKTHALAQEWAVWSKPTLYLMHVTLTARNQRVYSNPFFKYIRRHCPSRTWSFIVKHNALTHNRRRFGQQAATLMELNLAESNGGDGLRQRRLAEFF